MTEIIDTQRRYIMAGGMGAAALIASGVRLHAQEGGELPEYVSFKQADAVIVHSSNTLETRREAFGVSPLTSEERLYIRNNVSPPPETILEDRNAWEVSIEGVAEPRTLTIGELKTMGVETIAMVLQCSGNGRSYFEHAPSGTPWQVGAAGCVIWTGVPLRAVVDALGGVAEGAQFITGTGGEEVPEGLDERDVIVERSVPIDVLDTVMLAWDINGEPISLAHGGPLRMVVPGFTGVNNVKYVKRVALSEEESDALIQTERYRIHPVGTEGSRDYPSVWEMAVKSWITGPLEGAGAGMNQITGLAFGGVNAVESVEVSVDGGETWEAAEFIGPDLGRYAWRAFVLAREMEPGSYTIVSRATDREGNQQPEDTEPNEAGYNHNGWRAPGIELSVA